MIAKTKLAEKFAQLDEFWSPRVIADMDGSHLVKVAKLQGEFVWHAHDHEDELFLVVQGRLTIELRDQVLELEPSELVVIPAGVEHRPVAREECHVLIFEKKNTAHTGSEQTAFTRSIDEQLRPLQG
jgi:mannose-6-phosphate isomerase-like protein (cupin superfamily)